MSANTELELSLAERRRQLQEQLREQRQRIARKFAIAVAEQGVFPRSITVRLLIQRPELLIRLVAFVTGARTARTLSMILDLAWTLRSAQGGVSASAVTSFRSSRISPG